MKSWNVYSSNHYLITQKTRFTVSVEEILYKDPLTEMISGLKVAKKYMHVYCFHRKHFTCWNLCCMFETEKFGQKNSEYISLISIPII